MTANITKVGLRGGRQNPIHLGHEAIGKKSLVENDICVLFHGSIGEPQSIRNFFSDEHREQFVRTVFEKELNSGKLHLVKIKDVRNLANSKENNAQRVSNLDDLINTVVPGPKDVTFYGGSYEDINFFVDMGKKVSYVNRYDGPAANISASKIRDLLLSLTETEPNKIIRQQRLLDTHLVNPLIVEQLIDIFEQEWQTFKTHAVVYK